MDRIEAEAEKHGISPRAMLDKIVDDWMDAALPEPPDTNEEEPWYLKP